MKNHIILTIDDDSSIQKLLRNILEDNNYTIIEANDGEKGIEVFDNQKPDLVIVDLIMPKLDGFAVLNHIHSNSPDTPVIVISGASDINDPVKALKLGAWDYILKPIKNITSLLHAVEKCLERAQLINENKKYHNQLEELVLLKTNELQKANDNLKISEERYRSIFENFQDVYFETLLDGTILELSPSAYKYSGSTRESLIGTNIIDFYKSPLDRENFIKALKDNGKVQDFEVLLINKNKKQLYCSLTAKILNDKYGRPNKIIGTLRDITNRKHDEEKIKEQLKEKEVLIQEIHHRVKNNMQIINSLLFMQAEFIDDEKVKQNLKQIEYRIQSMALVHNQLYLSNSLSKILLKEYINELVHNIIESFQSNIIYVHNIEDIHINIDTAIPIGLIINEIITNSVKYAFPNNNTNKEITINCSLNDDNCIDLMIFDNGIGIDTNLEIRNKSSLGLTLVDALVQQLDGKFELTNTPGACYNISIKPPAS